MTLERWQGRVVMRLVAREPLNVGYDIATATLDDRVLQRLGDWIARELDGAEVAA